MLVEVKFLDADAIIEMHDAMLEEWGGHPGGGHRGALYEGVDAAVQAVKNSYYESIEELAAAYAVYIVQGHVFMDGNKRTGAATVTTFLVGNRVPVKISWNELYDAMIELQVRSEAGEDTTRLIAWLSEML